MSAKVLKLISHLFFVSLSSAIIVTWVIVTISAIPVGVSHGTVDYTNHKSEINTACLFLTDEGTTFSPAAYLAQILSFFRSLFATGYNWAAFQVKTAEKILIIRIKSVIEIMLSHRATSPLLRFPDLVLPFILHRPTDVDFYSLRGHVDQTLAFGAGQ